MIIIGMVLVAMLSVLEGTAKANSKTRALLQELKSIETVAQKEFREQESHFAYVRRLVSALPKQATPDAWQALQCLKRVRFIERMEGMFADIRASNRKIAKLIQHIERYIRMEVHPQTIAQLQAEGDQRVSLVRQIQQLYNSGLYECLPQF